MFRIYTKVIAILVCPVFLYAQLDPYPPDTVRMTPEVDLGLHSVPLIVPDKFARTVPRDLTLNLPPGFTVKVFAAIGLGRWS